MITSEYSVNMFLRLAVCSNNELVTSKFSSAFYVDVKCIIENILSIRWSFSFLPSIRLRGITNKNTKPFLTQSFKLNEALQYI